MYLPAFFAALIAIESSTFTASFRSSNRCATMPESRSRPSVSCVRSFEPIEKPSNSSRNWSASSAFDGISHIMISLRPFSPRFSPFFASVSITFRPSSTVRTNGIITHAFVRPISSRTFFMARHSSAKQSANDGST